MAFQFRLKALLRHREHKLQEARTAFAAAESFRQEIRFQIETLRRKALEECERFENEQEKGIDPTRYINFKNYMVVTDRELLRLRGELEKAAGEAELRRRIMIEWNKGVELLEKIESRDRESYQYQASRKEQKKMDEAAVFKDYRDRASGGRRDEE